jgi:hypothetical protein
MDPLQILTAALALGDQISTMIDRYRRGELTDEQLKAEWDRIGRRNSEAERIMDSALKLRATTVQLQSKQEVMATG